MIFQSQRGFTLIELLIVITLIGILAVAVLSTINPIEQVNKARDARKKADASQFISAIDRYFTSKEKFPWTEYLTAPLNNNSAFGGPAYLQGWGVCGTITAGSQDLSGSASTDRSGKGGCIDPGLLIDADELKSQFSKRDFLSTAATTDDEKKIWLLKEANDSTTWACFKPASKNVQETATVAGNNLKSLTFSGDNPTAITACSPGAPDNAPASLDWAGTKANWCFSCVPE